VISIAQAGRRAFCNIFFLKDKKKIPLGYFNSDAVLCNKDNNKNNDTSYGTSK